MLIYESTGKCYCGEPCAPDDPRFCAKHTTRHHYRCLICGKETVGENHFCSIECEDKGYAILRRRGIFDAILDRKIPGFMYLCCVCGKPIRNPDEFIFCGYSCRHNARLRFKKPIAGSSIGLIDNATHLGNGGSYYMRKCHDCGRPTTNYRCDKCLTKWKIKNGVKIYTKEDKAKTVENDVLFSATRACDNIISLSDTVYCLDL